MTVSIYDPEKNSTVTLTSTAVSHIKKEIQKNNAIGFRLGIKKAGCSGFKYVVDFVFEKNSVDHLIEIETDLMIYIDQEVKWKIKIHQSK
jgi:Fe-S cluster assembly iron-binding protein IscA